MPKNGSLATNTVEVVGRIRRSDARSIPLIKSVNSIKSYGKDYYDTPTWRLLPHQRIARQSVQHDTAQHQITHEYLYMDPMVIILR